MLLVMLFLFCACAGEVQPVASADQPTPTNARTADIQLTATATRPPLPASPSTKNTSTPHLQTVPPAPPTTLPATALVEPCIPDAIPLEKIIPGHEPKVSSQFRPGRGDEQVRICQAGQVLVTGRDLILPDLVTLPPSDLNLRVNPSNGQKLLRFTNFIANNGPGKMELWGDSDPETGNVTVTQHITTAQDSIQKVAVGEFFFHREHNHWHFGNFARYEVLSLTLDVDLDRVLASGNKISYCLRDDARSNIPDAARWQTYTSCEKEEQGISVGWIDVYRYHLPGQSIDISSLSDGVYALRSTVNPGKNIWEQNTENNAAILFIQIEGNHVKMIDPPGKGSQTLKGKIE